MSTTADNTPKSTATDELLVLADAVADLKDRFERVETEFSTQAKPLEATALALSAALSGIKALQGHVLENSLGALGDKVEAQRKAIDEQVTAIVADLRRADEAQAAQTGETAGKLRSELAELRSHVSALQGQFAAQITRVELEAKRKVEELAAIPAPVAKEGRSINPTGSYAEDRAYSRLDLVSYLGGSYISNEDNNREKPGARSKKWTQVAARGTGGGITDVTGIPGIAATAVAFLQSPSSASLGAAVGDETGTGAIVFATGPTITNASLT